MGRLKEATESEGRILRVGRCVKPVRVVKGGGRGKLKRQLGNAREGKRRKQADIKMLWGVREGGGGGILGHGPATKKKKMGPGRGSWRKEGHRGEKRG